MSPSVFSLYTAVTAPFSSVYSRTAGLISIRMMPPVFCRKGPKRIITGSRIPKNRAQAVAAAAMRKGRRFLLFTGAASCSAGAKSEGMARTILSSSLSSFFFQLRILLSLL